MLFNFFFILIYNFFKSFFNRIFPLPQFNINDPLDGQRPFYNEVFKHFATRLLQILENSPICLSSSSAFELFKELVSSTEDKDWKRLIMDARIKAKKREYERIWLKNANMLLKVCTSSFLMFGIVTVKITSDIAAIGAMNLSIQYK